MGKIVPVLRLPVLAVNVYGGDCPGFRRPDGDGQIAEIELINRLAGHLIATNRKVEQSNRKINPDFRLHYYGIIPR